MMRFPDGHTRNVWHRSGWLQHICQESGHSLVESVVALAIFTAVALPASAFLMRAYADPAVPDTVTALGLAERCMESTLAHSDFSDKDEVHGRVVLQRRVVHGLGHATIEVTARRGSYGPELAMLRTSRATD